MTTSASSRPRGPDTGGRPGPVRRYRCEWLWDGEGDVAPDVLVEVGAEGTVTDVARAAPAGPGAEELPGLTIPGMANSHSHAFHRALRGRTHDGAGSFWTWRERMYGVAARLDPDSYHRLARAVYAEMALAGITCVGEFHYLHHGPGGTPYADPNAMSAALVAAAADAGIRVTLLDACYLTGGPSPEGARPLRGAQLRFGDADAEAWADRVAAFRPDGPHARVGAAVHSVRAVPREQIPAVAEWAAEEDRPLHVHLSEQPAENEACLAAYGSTPAVVLADAGALTRRTSAVHATHLADGDVAALRAARCTVCLCPTTERDLADGVARVPDLLAASGTGAAARLALGTDGHAQIDMFEEMRGAELHERLRGGRRGVLAPRDLARAALAHGHASLGWDESGPGRAGAIVPGARADLVTLDTDGVRLAGFDPAHAIGAVVFAATAADVRHVMADGRWIVRDGVHQGIPDLPRVLDAAVKESNP
ncbi:formimidoylglutamate deiminase [Actinorugispora endophytica]|uniref:Formiminoglutamate deiminase n=1 Tax=Actinorugispora endophytica TaxID=1605990 RepID=A0A4R6UQN6_9ACTN|nr:formimidoylglutamate deiminase [Actinorugispora endophytica]TDQ47575.1 formiminoglutamate deiminase [Actinorugispora endophytica]